MPVKVAFDRRTVYEPLLDYPSYLICAYYYHANSRKTLGVHGLLADAFGGGDGAIGAAEAALRCRVPRHDQGPAQAGRRHRRPRRRQQGKSEATVPAGAEGDGGGSGEGGLDQAIGGRRGQRAVETEQTKAELASLPAKPAAPIPDNVRLPQIEQAISKREAELEKWRKALADDEAEPKRRAARRLEIARQDHGGAKERLTDINAELQSPRRGDERLDGHLRPANPASGAAADGRAGNPLLREGVGGLRGAGRVAAVAAATWPRGRSPWPSRRSSSGRRSSTGGGSRRPSSRCSRPSWEAGQAHPAVHAIGRGERRAGRRCARTWPQRIVDTTRQLEQVNQQLTAPEGPIQARRRRRSRRSGLTNAIGLLLRKQREALPNLRDYRRNIGRPAADDRRGPTCAAAIADDQRGAGRISTSRPQAVLQSLEPGRQDGNRAELETAVREALKTEREYLDALIGDHNTYFDKLVDLDNAEQQLIDETERCARYIDERVLWIASAAPLSPADVQSRRRRPVVAGRSRRLARHRPDAAGRRRAESGRFGLGAGRLPGADLLAAAVPRPDPGDRREGGAGQLLPLPADAGSRRC